MSLERSGNLHVGGNVGLSARDNQDSGQDLASSLRSHRWTRARLRIRRVCLVAIMLVVGTVGRTIRADFNAWDPSYMELVANAPGYSETSVFAGFENDENVSEVNGELLITHAAMPAIPLDGGRSLQLVRSFNSANIREEKAGLDTDGGQQPVSSCGAQFSGFYGRSWVGAGWTMNLGRYFTRAEYFHDYQVNDPSFGISNCPSFSARDHVFEAPSGTEYQVLPWPIHANPEIVTSGPGISLPDGTLYTTGSDLIVCHQVSNQYIDNADRCGGYTTSIQDPHGNRVDVEYYGAAYPYPEAIRTIKVKRFPETASTLVVQTILWDKNNSAHTANPDWVAAADGTLKELQVLGANGQWVSYRYYYSSLTVSDGIWTTKTITVPLLKRVEAPDTGDGSNHATVYEYQPFSIYPASALPYLIRVTYPAGGVSEYNWGTFRSGSRCGACPSNYNVNRDPYPIYDMCADWRKRTTFGVVSRTVWPDGKQTGASNYTWQWDRDLQGLGDQTATVNKLDTIYPDGRRSHAEVYGAIFPAADCPVGVPDGFVSKRVQYSAVGSSTPFRTEDLQYDIGANIWRDSGVSVATKVLLKQKTTTYNDDTGAGFCDDGGQSGAPRQMVEFFNRRDAHQHWQLHRFEGDYLKGPRIEYTEYSAQSCQTTNHVVDSIGYSAIDEGTSRAERVIATDCEGRVTSSRRKNEFIGITPPAPLGTWQGGESIALPTAANADLDDVTRSYTYDAATGNLSSVQDSGGDADLDGNRKTYSANVDFSFGVPARLQLGTAGWYARDLTIGPAGQVAASRDASGAETTLAYDALGRLTAIDPPGVEYATRGVYPDVHTNRVIKSAGTETSVTDDEGQSFLERRFDGLGRLNEIRKALPYGKKSVRVTRYDEDGRVTFVSEWMDADGWDSGAIARVTWSDGHGFWVQVPVGGSGQPLGTTTFYGAPSPTVSPRLSPFAAFSVESRWDPGPAAVTPGDREGAGPRFA